MLEVPPECDREFPRESHDADLSESFAAPESSGEPHRQSRSWLMHRPSPRELDERRAYVGVTGFRDSLFAFRVARLVWCIDEPGVSANLSAVTKAAPVEHLVAKDEGGSRTNTGKPLKRGRL